MLTGYLRKIVHNGVDHLCVIARFAAADIYNNLIELRNLHNALVAEFFHQRGSYFTFVSIF